MKKLIYTILFCAFTSVAGYAQFGEFQYFVVRAGINHSIISPQPEICSDKFIKTPGGELPLYSTRKFVEGNWFTDYTVGHVVDLLFHYDTKSNKFGIALGIEYSSTAISARYTSEEQDYSMTERFRNYAVGVPFMLKFSDEMFDRQKYFFVGARYEKNLKVVHKQIPDWLEVNQSTEQMIRWCEPLEFNEYNLSFFVGFNYAVFNIEINYLPSSFMNPQYAMENPRYNGQLYNELVEAENPSGFNPKEHDPGTAEFFPYQNHPKNYLSLRTSLTLPLNTWSSKNWLIQKIIRKFKRMF